jgi:hypothetical protein
MWGYYHQILGPRRHLPKFANGHCGHSDVWVRLHPHLTWQATKSYVERGNAFGFTSHKGSLTICSGTAIASSLSGTGRLSALAVLRLITSSNLIGVCTGKWAEPLPVGDEIGIETGLAGSHPITRFGRVRLLLQTFSRSSPRRSDPLVGSLDPTRCARRRRSPHRRREWRRSAGRSDWSPNG